MSRKGQAQSFTPKATRDAEKRIRAAFKTLYPGFEPLGGRLVVDVRFYRQTARRVDLDNLVKLITDALNGLAYVDDEQIEVLHAERVYSAGSEARAEIRVREIER